MNGNNNDHENTLNGETIDDETIDEEFQDLEKINNWADGAVLWSTDWTAETVLSQLDRGNINLDPVFQRRAAWTSKRQSLFIESLILGLPIPQLILAEDRNRKGSFIVIDGKQRLLAIRAFASGEGSKFAPLKLTGLEELGYLNGSTYTTMFKDELLRSETAAFDNSSIRTIVIRNWKNESYLYEVFLRINTGSVQLSPQELRQALHPGPFSAFIDWRSADSKPLMRALGLTKPDFRMRDAELLLRFMAYRFFPEAYRGNLKKFLDSTTMTINEEWSELESQVKNAADEMDAALIFTMEIFGEKDYLRKWNGQKFERQKNRAVIDIMLYYFSKEVIRHSVKGSGGDVVAAFKRLCAENEDFRTSLETTTKSTEANTIRFGLWAQELGNIIGEKIFSPFEND